jgi:hypothetical protein
VAEEPLKGMTMRRWRWSQVVSGEMWVLVEVSVL